MRIVPFSLALAAALNVGLQAPLVAWAATPSGGVQPVPYNPSQPVPVAPPSTQPPPPAPVAAPPSSTGGDTIFLKGGGMIRGRLVEIIPNDHATIALSTGQTAIVEWGRIERIEQQQAPQPAPVVVPPPTVIKGPSGSAWVHIETDKELVLEGRPADGGWMVVCSAPCDANLPLDSDYRISGGGVRTSRVFRINGQPG